MTCPETKCARCEEEGTMCEYCARTKENDLKAELTKSLSEEQLKIFQDLLEVMNYRSSQIFLAS